MGFFSAGKSTQESWSGLRGLGDTAQQMANFLVPATKRGATFGEQLFTNPMIQLQPDGLYAAQSALFPSVVNQIASQMSAGLGARGQLSPENIGSVAGSSATAAAPFLLPLIGQNIASIRDFGGNLFSNALGQGYGGLGSYSKAQQTGPGIGYNWANEFGKNLTQWVNPSTFSGGGGKGFFGGP